MLQACSSSTACTSPLAMHANRRSCRPVCVVHCARAVPHAFGSSFRLANVSGNLQRKLFASARRTIIAAATAVEADSYVCLGLALCFEKTQDGRLVERTIIEPISASSLECMATGARTSFKLATGLSYRDALARNRELLPEEFKGGVFCEKFEYRLDAAVRTWQRPHAQDNLMDIVPLGKVKGSFNFSTEDKRVLNFENTVDDSDNVKQDMSIDVYGRAKKEEIAAKLAAEAAAEAEAEADKAEQEEDDLDALLAA